MRGLPACNTSMIETEPQLRRIADEAHGPHLAEGEISLLDLLVVLLELKRFIVRFVVGAAILATIVSFLLPVRYEAKIVLLPPAQNSSIGSELLGQMGSLGSLGSLASLAGGTLGNQKSSICMLPY